MFDVLYRRHRTTQRATVMFQGPENVLYEVFTNLDQADCRSFRPVYDGTVITRCCSKVLGLNQAAEPAGSRWPPTEVCVERCSTARLSISPPACHLRRRRHNNRAPAASPERWCRCDGSPAPRGAGHSSRSVFSSWWHAFRSSATGFIKHQHRECGRGRQSSTAALAIRELSEGLIRDRAEIQAFQQRLGCSDLPGLR